MSDKLKALHGKKYVEKFESGQSKERLDRLIRLFQLSPDMKICDFGCGNAMLLPYLQPIVSQYTGVDFSEDFIRVAKKKALDGGFSDTDFFCDEINHFCSQHQYEFDAGFAMDFSEHVPNGEWLEILKSIKSALKRGAKLYIHTPNADFIVEILKEKSFLLKQLPEHVAVRTGLENIRLLERAGFSSIKLSYLPHYNVLRFVHYFSYLPIIGKFFKARIFIEAEA